MALNEIQQLKKILDQSQYLLVVFNSKDNGDAVGSALALKLFGERLNKQVDVACSEFTTPKNLKFLPEIQNIKPELAHLQKFIIKVDVSKAPIETLSYEVKDNWLSIYLTPKHGVVTKHELRTAQSTFKYDLIITVNTPDLDSLGSIFFNNTDLFYRTPIINLDHESHNERYGQVNVVDTTTSSTAEVVYTTLTALDPSPLSSSIATALLTGMTVATKSFKYPQLSPTALHRASELVKLGAEREKIVQHLYRTRSVATLKLWGAALSHLQTDRELGLVWATLTREDFSRSGTSPSDLYDIVDELISNSPEAKIIMLLYEEDSPHNDYKKIGGLISTDKNANACSLVPSLQPEGDKHRASFVIENKTLAEAESNVLALIRHAAPRR